MEPKKRILILGSNGMAGHMIHNYLNENSDWEIMSWGKEEFEIKEKNNWKDKIKDFNRFKKIDYIINCIACLTKSSNKNPPMAIKINSLFPHELAELCTELGIKIIHISTDAWKDSDVYGRSKRAGELECSEHLTIRASIIGPELKEEGVGLFHWFMTQEGKVNGFNNHFWDGVTTLELAKTMFNILKTNKDISGIQDFRIKGSVNKFELLKYISETFNKNILIEPKETETVDRTNNNPDIICSIPLSDQIRELKDWMEKHPKLYTQYGF